MRQSLAAALLLFAGFLWWFTRPLPDQEPEPIPIRAHPEIQANALPAQQLATPLALTGDSLANMRLVEARYNSGDYLTAIELAEKDLANNNLEVRYRKWLEKQLPVLYTTAGWSKLQLGDCETAIVLLQKTAQLAPLPETHKGLFVCYVRLRQKLKAEEAYTDYSGQVKPEPTVEWLYSELLESEGQFDKALAHIEVLAKNSEAAQELPGLATRIKNLRARLKEGAHQITSHSEHVRLTYRLNEHSELVDPILEAAEEVISELAEWGLALPEAPVEVLLYPASEFHTLVSESPKWVGGVFDGRVRIPIGGDGMAAILPVLRHEMFHALVARVVRDRALPPWFNEGAAQFFECPGGCRDFRFSANHGNFLPLGEFEKNFLAKDSLRAKQLYQQSAYLVLTLQRGGIGIADAPFAAILASLSHTSRLDSDNVLKAAGTDFKTLHTRAAQNWRERKAY